MIEKVGTRSHSECYVIHMVMSLLLSFTCYNGNAATIVISTVVSIVILCLFLSWTHHYLTDRQTGMLASVVDSIVHVEERGTPGT